jgi:(hydroxyamino)benzene mutase
MNAPHLLSRQGHRLLQIGVALFLFTCFEGFAVPYFRAPVVGRSVHTLSALFALILLAFGLIWPRLRLGAAASRTAFWFLVYSGFAIATAFALAAIWGAGQSTMPLSGAPMGSTVQEAAILVVAYSSAPTGIISFALILWGLRGPPPEPSR